ncbi:hypothetical protein D9M68_867330 [compost metagenome]
MQNSRIGFAGILLPGMTKEKRLGPQPESGDKNTQENSNLTNRPLYTYLAIGNLCRQQFAQYNLIEVFIYDKRKIGDKNWPAIRKHLLKKWSIEL